MTPTYAANTDVPVARSRDEIERTLAATEAFPIFQQALPAPSDSWMEVAL